MSANHKIQKTTGGVVHAGSWMGNEADPRTSKYGYFTPSCGSGVVYAMGSLRNIAGFRELPQDTKVTCKKCLKLIEKAEQLGLHLKVEKNEDGSSKVVDTREEVVPEQAPEIKPGRCLSRIAEPGKNFFQCVREHGHGGEHAMMTPDASPTAQALAKASAARDLAMKEAYEAEGTPHQAVMDAAYEQADDAYHAARVAHRNARIAAGDDVEPIAARPPKPQAAKPEPFTYTYDAMAGVLIADALREKAETHRKAAKGYRANADLKTGLQAFYAEQARIADNNAQLLEDEADKIHAPVKATLADEMGRALDKAMEKPFHRQVKDAIGLKW